MLRILRIPRRLFSATVEKPKTEFPLDYTLLKFSEQNVHAGVDSLPKLVDQLKSKKLKSPLIVSDQGVNKAGIVAEVKKVLDSAGFKTKVFSEVNPDPTVNDVLAITQAYDREKCDFFVGVGGGGPLDAMKGAQAVVAQSRSDKHDLNSVEKVDQFVGKELKDLLRRLSPKTTQDFGSLVPLSVAVPTTSGTGSEGGKSAVIRNLQGVKQIFGHPLFFPSEVALVPQFTVALPPQLTASTGIDAFGHLAEAYFVTEKAGIADGLDPAGIERCDNFALEGIKLILKYLPIAYKQNDNLQARLYMQVAALYGAKAFRKGDLGGIHATAHALGATYHIHHGTSIARMAVPVIDFNERKADEEFNRKKGRLLEIFSQNGIKETSLSLAVKQFLVQFNELQFGLQGISVGNDGIEKLAQLASSDPCQTNPIPLGKKDYLEIFQNASKM